MVHPYNHKNARDLSIFNVKHIKKNIYGFIVDIIVYIYAGKTILSMLLEVFSCTS